MLTHFSLFSGIGGLDLAAEMAGFRTIGQVEIDDYCNRVLEYHWPDVPRWRDVRDVTRESVRKAGIGAITVISGGFPCQPFSQAGKRGGTEDDRYLWPEMLRVIDELRPAWVIAENVNGIVSMELEILSVAVEGRTIGRFKDYDFYRAVYTRQEVMLLGTICQELEAKGYEVQPLAIPACAVEAPHERRRVFIVGYAGSCGLSGESRRGAGQEFTDGYTQSQAGDVADPAQQLLNRPRTSRPAGRAEFADGGAGPTQSGLGSMVNEFSTRMDGGINNADAREKGTREVLPALREKDEAKTLQRQTGGHGSIPSPEILQPSMCRSSKTEGYTTWNPQTLCLFTGQQVPRMWCNREFGSAPSRRQPCQQRHLKFNDFMRFMSYEMALEEREEAIQEAVCLHRLWQSCKEVGYVPKTLSEVQEIWKSLSDQEKAWIAFRVSGRTGWPAGPGEQHEWEPPRIATGVKDRVAKLKALGNAVVPAQAYPIFQAIAEIERSV